MGYNDGNNWVSESNLGLDNTGTSSIPLPDFSGFEENSDNTGVVEGTTKEEEKADILSDGLLDKYHDRLLEITPTNPLILFRGVKTKGSGVDLGQYKYGVDYLIDWLLHREEYPDAEVEITMEDLKEHFNKNQWLSEDDTEGLEVDYSLFEDDTVQGINNLTYKAYGEIQKNLKDTIQKINTIQKDTGAYTSYIGFPFLEGVFNSNEQHFRAPLFLFPVDIIQTRTGYAFKHNNYSEIRVNTTLFLAFEKYTGHGKVDVPDFIEKLSDIGVNSLEDLEEYLYDLPNLRYDIKESTSYELEGISKYTKSDFSDKYSFAEGNKNITDASLHQPLIRLKPYVVFSSFKAATSISRDFEVLKNGEKTQGILSGSKTISRLLGKHSEDDYQSDDGSDYSENVNITKLLERDMALINQLDTSQEFAVWEATQSKDLTIFGPPGTGKSQVMSNIISNNVHKNKNILMVSQKKTALDVVFNRLGVLNTKALLLASDLSKKKEFYATVKREITRVLDYKPTVGVTNFLSTKDTTLEGISDEIEGKLKTLDRLHYALTDKENPIGISLSAIYHTAYKLSDDLSAVYTKHKDFSNLFNELNLMEVEQTLKILENTNITQAYSTVANFKDTSLLSELVKYKVQELKNIQIDLRYINESIDSIATIMQQLNHKYAEFMGMDNTGLLKYIDSFAEKELKGDLKLEDITNSLVRMYKGYINETIKHSFDTNNSTLTEFRKNTDLKYTDVDNNQIYEALMENYKKTGNTDTTLVSQAVIALKTKDTRHYLTELESKLHDLKKDISDSLHLKEIEKNHGLEYNPFLPNDLEELGIISNSETPSDKAITGYLSYLEENTRKEIDKLTAEISSISMSDAYTPSTLVTTYLTTDIILTSSITDFDLVADLYKSGVTDIKFYNEALKNGYREELTGYKRKVSELKDIISQLENVYVTPYESPILLDEVKKRGIDIIDSHLTDDTIYHDHNLMYSDDGKLLLSKEEFISKKMENSVVKRTLLEKEQEVKKFRILGKSRVQEEFTKAKEEYFEHCTRYGNIYLDITRRVTEYHKFTNVVNGIKKSLLTQAKIDLERTILDYDKLLLMLKERTDDVVEALQKFDVFKGYYNTAKFNCLEVKQKELAKLVTSLDTPYDLRYKSIKLRIASNVKIHSLFNKEIEKVPEIEKVVKELRESKSQVESAVKSELKQLEVIMYHNIEYKKAFDEYKEERLIKLRGRETESISYVQGLIVKAIDNSIKRVEVQERVRQSIFSDSYNMLNVLTEGRQTKGVIKTNTSGYRVLYDVITEFLQDSSDYYTIYNLNNSSRLLLQYVFFLIDNLSESKPMQTEVYTLSKMKLPSITPESEDLFDYSNMLVLAELIKHQYLNYNLNELKDMYSDDLQLRTDFDVTVKDVDELRIEKESKVANEILNLINKRGHALLLSSRHEEKFNLMKKEVQLDVSKAKSIRNFMLTYFEEMKILFPIFLLTPENVSQVIPLEADIFDKVLFDEASQMFIERALPSAYRGKSIVVAGDDKQLKPSDNKGSRLDSDEDNAFTDDEREVTDIIASSSESLLDMAKINIPSVHLLYHYRSKYNELITFSNYAFYNRTLKLAPNILKASTTNKPIERIKVDGVWLDSMNKPEADAVAILVKELLLTRGNEETIGIIAFSKKQATEIENSIQKIRNTDVVFNQQYNKEISRYEDGEDLSIFVKSIDDVQGDERDIIILATGYDIGENGKFPPNFGALSREGGENRLNVAITRAKQKMYLVTSFEPESMRQANNPYNHDGANLLREFCYYVRAVDKGDTETANIILETLCPRTTSLEDKLLQFDSIFEEQVYTQLTLHGFEVETQVGVNGYKIDLAVYDAEKGQYLAGIECDGATYHSSPSARERDIYRQKFLESKGWTILRIWSTDWWNNNNREISRIVDELNKLRGV